MGPPPGGLLLRLRNRDLPGVPRVQDHCQDARVALRGRVLRHAVQAPGRLVEFGPYSCAPHNWALRVLINPVMSVCFMPITRDAESRTVAPGQPPSDYARSHPVGSASSSGFVVRLVAS